MVEMLGVLAIAGVLSVGGIWGFDRAAKIMRINTIKDEISTLVANIRSMHFTKGDYLGGSPEIIIGAGIVPMKYIAENGYQIKTPLKGLVYLGAAQYREFATGSFILVFNGFDSLTCREMAAYSWGNDVSTGFLGMAITTTGEMTVESSGLNVEEVPTTETTFHPHDLPQALLEDTYRICDCGTTDNCSIAWKFR